MKKIYLVLIVLSLLSAGCTTPEDKIVDSSTTFPSYSKEKFSMTYPDWEETESDDPANNITLASKQCWFALNIVDVPPGMYEMALKEYIINNKGTIISDSPLSYTLSSNSYTFKTTTRGSFCDDRAYFALYTCLEDQFDEKIADGIFNSMECEKEWDTPHRTSKKLGLVVLPQNVSDITSFYKAYNLARDNNVQMTHFYATWGQVENNWTGNDLMLSIIENKGLKVSVAFDIIHTSVIGELPDDITFKRWDDPILISRFSDFVIEYIERYGDTIEYVEIGNEVDIYLYNHPDELDSYTVFYKEVYNNIKKAHPDMKVGTVFAYHELKNNNNFEVYSTLSPIGDFDAFTLYIYSPGFIFDREPVEIYEYLKEIEELTEERHFALEEVGWNPYIGLKGTEEDQRQAVSYFFDYLEEAPDRLEFATWYILHDGTEDACMKSARSYFDPGEPVLENDKVMGPFSDFICYLGLIRSDGTPRAGWFEFTQRAREYADS